MFEPAQRWRPVRSNRGLGCVMAAEPLDPCRSFLPNDRLLRCDVEPRYACFERGYATMNGCRLPEEVNNHERKDVAVNRDVSYCNFELFVAFSRCIPGISAVHL